MREIWIPEFFIVLFLFLALIRPWIKKLEAQDGIFWLPPLALLISIGLFPAYGWRPEALPLMLSALGYCVVQFPLVFSGGRRGRSQDRDSIGNNPVLFLAGVLFLGFSMVLIFVFSPLEKFEINESGVINAGETEPVSPDGRVFEFVFHNRENEENREINVKFYGKKDGPLLVMRAPVFGEPAVERVCAELQKRGFAVFAFSGSGRAQDALTYLFAFVYGKKTARANTAGRALEEAGKKDYLFVLDQIAQNPEIGGGLSLFDAASRDIFLCGYDVSAAALVLLAGDSGFVKSGPPVKGVIAAGPSLWSLYKQEERALPESPPPGRSWFKSFSSGLGRWISGLKPKKIIGPQDIPQAEIPLLLLLSGGIIDDGDSYYDPVHAVFKAAKKPVVLSALPGAVPCDYAGFSSEYPLISFLSGGRRDNKGDPEKGVPGLDGETAQIISNFASILMEAEASAEIPAVTFSGVSPNFYRAAARSTFPARAPLPKDAHIETRSWFLPSIRLY